MSSTIALAKSAGILVYGSDELLLETRTMVLEKSGYLVFSALEISDVDEILLMQDISLLMCCHTLSSEKCVMALKVIQNRDPTVRALVLTAGALPSFDQAPDAILNVLDGPRKLLETVDHLLQPVPTAS